MMVINLAKAKQFVNSETNCLTGIYKFLKSSLNVV